MKYMNCYEISDILWSLWNTIQYTKYYEIYKIAKDKAKQHKKAAISHYLEAKKIKNTYLLDDLDNSDESSEEEDSDSEKVKNEINEIVEELL